MTEAPRLTDRESLLRFRARAMAMDNPALFLHERAILEVQERLELVNRTFTSPLIITGFTDVWRSAVPNARIVTDSEHLDLSENAHDLIIHAMSLHWANDPVGQLIQARIAMKPDGLFLAVFPGGQTLFELRQSMGEAEVAVTGGLSPHVAPMGDIRDLGALLQRAGFALPVADADPLCATYDSALHLMRDLRAMGEGNALTSRNRRPLPRAVLQQTVEVYEKHFAKGGRIPATFELITLTGWAASDNQPKPLKPGSATAHLSDILKDP